MTLIIFGVGMSIVPLTGQNWGAKKYDRVFEARRKAIIFAVIYCAVMFIISLPLARPVSRIFTQDPEVIKYSAYYLWIMTVGLIGLTVTNWMSQMFTTIGRPLWTVLINVVGTLCVIIPLAYIGRVRLRIYRYSGGSSPGADISRCRRGGACQA